MSTIYGQNKVLTALIVRCKAVLVTKHDNSIEFLKNVKKSVRKTA